MPDGQSLILGRNNTSNAETSLNRGGAAFNTAFSAINQNGNGIAGRSRGPGSGLNPALYGVWGDAGVNGFGVAGTSASDTGVFGISDQLNSAGVSGLSYSGYGVTGDGGRGGVSGSSYSSPGVSGWSFDYTGVYGYSENDTGVSGAGPNIGVSGQSTDGLGVSGQSTNGYGVCGDGGDIADGVLGKSGAGFGVSGESGNVAVYARNTLIAAPNTAYLGSRCCAGDFYGQVYVHGNFTVAGGHKGFKIDHPLDPADRYLNHFSVDSPDVKNVYDGIVELDEDGEAVVELPEYFEALNTDFRYQLTPVGAPGPNLHIVQEVSDNQFKIAGGTPESKVSWQVTGVRVDVGGRDEADRVAVEEENPAEERGYYLRPVLYGEPAERGIEWARYGEHRQPTEQRERRIEEQQRQRMEELRQRMEELRQRMEEGRREEDAEEPSGTT